MVVGEGPGVPASRAAQGGGSNPARRKWVAACVASVTAGGRARLPPSRVGRRGRRRGASVGARRARCLPNLPNTRPPGVRWRFGGPNLPCGGEGMLGRGRLGGAGSPLPGGLGDTLKLLHRGPGRTLPCGRGSRRGGGGWSAGQRNRGGSGRRPGGRGLLGWRQAVGRGPGGQLTGGPRYTRPCRWARQER